MEKEVKNKDWSIIITSDICPYRETGGLNDNSASATLYIACSIMKGYTDKCNPLTCPKVV